MNPFKKRITAVLVFDGQQWSAGVYSRGGKGWEQRAVEAAPSLSVKQLPTDMLEFLAQQGVREARILVPADLHSVRMTLPPDLAPEEIHTAFSYELAQEQGTEVGALRLAATDAALFGMGCEPESFLVAAVDGAQVESYVQQLKPLGVKVSGVGGLELGLLGLSASEHAQERLLLLRTRSGFYAVPGTEEQPFYMSSVQIGLREETTDRDRERLERLQRRLHVNNALGLRVITAAPENDAPADRAHTVVGTAENVQVVTLDSLLPSLMELALAACPGDTQDPCALVGPPTGPRDPYRAGTWICLGIVLLTALYVGGRWNQMRLDLKDEQKVKAAWDTLVSEREKLKSRCSSLQQQRNQQQRIHKTLTQERRLPQGALELVNCLAREIPQYTRVTRVVQLESGGYEIEGSTRWAEGKNRFDRTLASALAPHGLLVEPGPLKYREDTRDQLFSYHIRPKGGAR